MIHIFYYRLVNRMPPEVFDHYLQQLTPAVQKKVQAFRHWQDAERSMAGNILLMKGLASLNIHGYSLPQLKYTGFQKPYFDGTLDFNISHSGSYILCAISDTHKIGVDVEEIKDIPLIDFTDLFYDKEWQAVLNSPDKLHAFYTLWTKKESFLKVIGSGLNVPLNQVVIENNTIHWQGQNWWLEEVPLDPSHVSWVCMDKPASLSNITRIEL